MAACTGTATVAPISSAPSNSDAKIPGRFVVTIETGAWHVQSRTLGLVCGEWSFDTNLDAPYETAMQEAFGLLLEDVTFSSELFTPERLKEENYSGLVLVSQKDAASTFSASEKILFRTVEIKVGMGATVRIYNRGGLVYRTDVMGDGRGEADVFVCPAIGEIVGASAHEAIRRLIENTRESVRLGLGTE